MPVDTTRRDREQEMSDRSSFASIGFRSSKQLEDGGNDELDYTVRVPKDMDSSSKSKLSEQLLRSQQQIAALKTELQELRDTTDEEYAVAVTLAAKERDSLTAQLQKLRFEQIALVSTNKVQQAHIDVLTQELINLKEESSQLRRTRESEPSELQKHLKNVQQGFTDFVLSFHAWTDHQEIDDGVLELKSDLEALQASVKNFTDTGEANTTSPPPTKQRSRPSEKRGRRQRSVSASSEQAALVEQVVREKQKNNSIGWIDFLLGHKDHFERGPNLTDELQILQERRDNNNMVQPLQLSEEKFQQQ